MRIAHVVESLEVGGAEHMVVALSRMQRARGHEVSIACLFREGPLAERAREAGVEVVNCGKRDGLDLAAVRRLRGWLARARPDVLHTHNPVPHYYAVAASLGRRDGCVINTRHGMGSAAGNGRRDRLFRFAMRFTDLGVAVCEAARERFVSLGILPEAKAVTVPNGIDLARFMPRNTEARQHLLESLGVPGDPFVFGSVGRLDRLKDQATMLRAFALLAAPANGTEGGPQNAILAIAGDGDEREALERERERLGLQGRVFLLGRRDDVPALLAGFDAFVLSSRTEGYSLALLEASASGLPIVATDVGGNGEIVGNERTGLLVPPQDPAALADAMRRVARDPEAGHRMGQAGRAWALANGSLDAMYRRYMNLYEGRRADATAPAAQEQR